MGNLPNTIARPDSCFLEKEKTPWSCDQVYPDAMDVWGAFNSSEELRHALEAYNIQQTTPSPNNDKDNLPTNEDEADQYVQELYDAMIDTSYCIWSNGGEKGDRIGRFIWGNYDIERVLLACHNFVADLVKFHRGYGRRIHMVQNKNWIKDTEAGRPYRYIEKKPTKNQPKLFSEQHIGFEERFETICNCVRHCKILCSDIIEGKVTADMHFIVAPKTESKTKGENFRSNTYKAEERKDLTKDDPRYEQQQGGTKSIRRKKVSPATQEDGVDLQESKETEAADMASGRSAAKNASTPAKSQSKSRQSKGHQRTQGRRDKVTTQAGKSGSNRSSAPKASNHHESQVLQVRTRGEARKAKEAALDREIGETDIADEKHNSGSGSGPTMSGATDSGHNEDSNEGEGGEESAEIEAGDANSGKKPAPKKGKRGGSRR